MCIAVANAGLGPEMKDTEGYFTNTGWFETNQFTLELIFHNRMKQYDCLTEDASKASAVYVPFYAGLEAARSLWDANLTLRDAVPNRFAEWVTNQPEWKMHNGWDHFIVGGRITWDFRRKDKENWGNRLLQLPAMQNMTSLVIEGSPWAVNDVGIPYPTYFHPSSDMEITIWQSKVRKFQRKVLFSFAGGARATAGSIRGNLIDQCRRSEFCKFLSCDRGACQTPQPVMKLFEESTFCLQPQGDSATRRSIFDSMLAGCIPVFFHQDSFSEYKWHFPERQEDYSLFIEEQHLRSGVLSLELLLRRISAKEIKRLRENIIRIIPDLVYADPRVAVLEKSVDAFDIAVKVCIQLENPPLLRVRVSISSFRLEFGGTWVLQAFIQSSNNLQSLSTNPQVLDSLSKWKVVMLQLGYAKVGMLLNKREFLGLHQPRAQAL